MNAKREKCKLCRKSVELGKRWMVGFVMDRQDRTKPSYVCDGCWDKCHYPSAAVKAVLFLRPLIRNVFLDRINVVVRSICTGNRIDSMFHSLEVEEGFPHNGAAVKFIRAVDGRKFALRLHKDKWTCKRQYS